LVIGAVYQSGGDVLIEVNQQRDKGGWKLLLHSGSGGNGYAGGNQSGRYAGTIEQKSFETGERQLYNLANDPNETKNIASENPEIVERLTKLTADIVKNGRSTAGDTIKQSLEDWPQLDWLP
jgi:hypothetical protein